MADNFTRNNFSIGQVNQRNTFSTPASYTSGATPAELLRLAEGEISSVTTMSYPLDLPKYYLGMTISSYQRDSLLSLGQGKQLYTLGLPLPDHMVDKNDITFNNQQFSATVGNVLNTSIAPVTSAVNKAVAGDFGGAASEVGKVFNSESLKSGGIGLAIDAVSGATGGKTGDGANAVKAATGYAPNYFLTVLLDGPQYKEFNFSWTFAPRSPQEAAELTKILRTIKNAQAVGLDSSNAFFKFPRIFRCFFSPDRAHLYQFKPAVLKSFVVDYSGGGLPAMHPGRSETGDLATPVIIKASATFIEMEFWVRSDFGSDTDANDPFANEATTSPGRGRND